VKNAGGIAVFALSLAPLVACRAGSPPSSSSTGAGGLGGAGGLILGECHRPDVDIPSATLAGTVTINGTPASQDPNARLLLRNGVNDLVEIRLAGASYSVRVAPGTYDVFFSATGPTAMAPINRLARLRTGVVVAADQATTLDVDIPATTVAGTITINGARLAAEDSVSVLFRNAAGDSATIAAQSGGAFAASLVPGTFDVFLSANAVGGGSATPVNQLARIATDVVIGAGSAALDLDVPSVTVAGGISIGGVPAGPTNRGWVYLKNAAGDVVKIGVANSASYEARVVPGSYDLYFTGTEDAYSVANQNVRLQTGIVVAATGVTALEVAVPAGTVTGTIRLDGEPTFITDKVHLALRNAAGDYAEIPWTGDGDYVVKVVPGSYDLYYSKDNTVPATTPANQLAKLRTGIVVAGGGTTLADVDIASSVVMGTVKINGVPASAGNAGILTLRAADGDKALIANTANPTFFARVVPGQYDLYYTRTATPANTTTPAPHNHAAKLRAGLVLAAGDTTVLDIDIPSTTVTGMVTINGKPAAAGDHGTLMVQNAAGDFGPFASTNGGTYTGRLVPGMYDLYYSHAGKIGDTTPMNTLIKLRCFDVVR
jgi:hypothetical protein